ncbi:MAG: glycosyltransferase family 2 protein [Candidatus Dojkabacteria bacterium]
MIISININKDIAPQISIVMPVYNVEEYIKEAIESILNQTFNNWELIIIDDGSTDRTKKILKPYVKSDLRIRYIRKEKNVGITKNLNYAISLAKADLIARMDGDDISSVTRLDIQYEYMKENPKCVLAGTWAEMIDEKGVVLQQIKYPIQDWYLRAKMLLGDYFIHGSVIFRKEIILNSGGYPLEYKFCEDYALWSKVMKYGKIANIPRILYKWRLHDITLQTEKLKIQKDNTALIQEKMCKDIKYFPERILLFSIKVYQTLKRWILMLFK